MPIFTAEIGKKSFILSAPSLVEAGEIISFYHKDKNIRITEGSLPTILRFRIGQGSICSLTKVKESVIYFTSETNMSGKVDIALLPIEVA